MQRRLSHRTGRVYSRISGRGNRGAEELGRAFNAASGIVPVAQLLGGRPKVSELRAWRATRHGAKPRMIVYPDLVSCSP